MEVRIHRWGKRPYIDAQLKTNGVVDCHAFVEKGPSDKPHDTVWLVSTSRSQGNYIRSNLANILSHEAIHMALSDVIGDLASNSYDRISNEEDRLRRGRKWAAAGF